MWFDYLIEKDGRTILKLRYSSLLNGSCGSLPNKELKTISVILIWHERHSSVIDL